MRPIQSLESRRLLSSAVFDPTFAGGGRTNLDIGGVTHTLVALMQPDGKLLIAGNVGGSEAGVGGDAFVARITDGGSLDPTFGANGVARLDLGDAEVFN